MNIDERLNQIAQRAYSTLPTIRASYNIACAAIRDGVPGDFVECGVGAGSNAAAMALAILKILAMHGADGIWRVAEKAPRVHLFDSFTGIPKCGEHDTEFIAANHPAGLTAHSEAEVQKNMREWGIPDKLLVWHPGMFDVTVRRSAMYREVVDHKIAVLRLDGDLYESTKVCIENLFPLVSKGGWVIVDDWDLSGARKAVMEYMVQSFGPISFQRQYV